MKLQRIRRQLAYRLDVIAQWLSPVEVLIEEPEPTTLQPSFEPMAGTCGNCGCFHGMTEEQCRERDQAMSAYGMWRSKPRKTTSQPPSG